MSLNKQIVADAYLDRCIYAAITSHTPKVIAPKARAVGPSKRSHPTPPGAVIGRGACLVYRSLTSPIQKKLWI